MIDIEVTGAMTLPAGLTLGMGESELAKRQAFAIEQKGGLFRLSLECNASPGERFRVDDVNLNFIKGQPFRVVEDTKVVKASKRNRAKK